MATSRQDDQEEQAVRPRRIHHLPGHLDDYVLTYPAHQSNPVYPDANMNILSSNVAPAHPRYTSAQLGDGVERSPEIERIRRMEQCVSRVQDQMRELQSTLQASLNLGRATSQMPLSQQARSRSLPLLTADYNPPIHDVVMHRLDHIPPFISSSSSPVPVPALSPIGGASAPQSVYASPSAQAAATPAVVSWPAAPITDQPHPPWQQQQQQQRDPNWPTSHPQWPTQPSVGQYSYARPMQTQPPVLLPMPPPGPPPLGQPVSQPYSTQVLPPTLSSPYMYQDPAYMQPPVSTHSAAPQNAPQFSSFLPAAQRPNLMEMAISSSYGIPKPKLVSFTSGKESDFLLLKKGLDGVLGPHPHLSEDYKFQVLLDHLKFPAAFQIAKRYVHDPIPYTKAMQALQQRYGQPRQLVQSEINNILRAPTVRAGDAQGFEDFALSVSSLVGLLNTLEGAAKSELECGSHVDRLLSKLPPSYQDSFAEYCLTRGILQSNSADTYTLPDFAQWLERKSQAIQISRRAAESCTVDKPRSDRKEKQFKQPKSSSSVYYGNNKPPTPAAVTSSASSDKIDPSMGKKREKFKPYCPFCSSTEHYLSSCPDFTKLTTVQIVSWINENKRCWRCGRGHQPDNCTLKKPCAICGEQHLQILHEASSSTNRSVLTVSTASSIVYLDQATHSGRVMLKVVPVTLHCKGKSLSTHAILDDGSERTIVLSAAVHYLQLDKIPESLKLRTIRQEVSELQGASVSFEISEPRCPKIKHHISNAFSATKLNLAKQSCPMDTLRQKYSHLSEVPFKAFKDVQPMLLIGSDNAHLITPLSPVKAGPLGTPVAVNTKLGWAIQGPATFLHQPTETSCLHTSLLPTPSQVLKHNVEKLWQLDVLPFRSEKEVTRSKQDKEALELLQNKTERVQVDGVSRYATPLLRCKNASKLQAGPESVMALLRSTERRLTKDPDLAAVYNAEVHKLEQQGYARKLTPEEASSTNESWFIPHHIVHHNNKPRIVFNCSFHYKQDCLNDQLLPGPTLGPSLIGVLLRFREYPVAVSGDIRGMFHQVRLITQDTPLLRFIWRDMERERSPDIYEWCVLPFGPPAAPVAPHMLFSAMCKTTKRAMSRSPRATLGLAWHCSSDQISYRCRPVPLHEPTMRNIYSILASQYDPLGFIIPFTTRAKLIVQLLWQKERHWDDPIDGNLPVLSWGGCCSYVCSQRIDTELQVLRQAQLDSFPAEMNALKAGKEVRSDSKLKTLSPEYDSQLGLIRVGGRLRRAENMDIDSLHPIVLSPDHPTTQLIIKDYDTRLFHPGPERVFAELRRVYWILRGRQAIRKHQHHCLECKKWRANPVTPKMSDLPASRLRLQQPPFWSTGIDCFGPFTVKIGRRQEKRWGIIFKCLTTRCVHLDLLSGMDTDCFLMALRRFIARKGKPFEILSDQGTNFKGGDRALQEAFQAMEPQLQEKLSEQSITFCFNPPHAPHFGGAWEREIRSVKSSLQVILQGQSVSEDLLHTVLIEVEGVLNSKPLGYVSSDIADIDPITPNMLLMGRRDASLPQAVYGTREQLGRRKWRHSQVIADHFWTQFVRRYLPSLQHRQKWQQTSPALALGQVVMVVDSQLPRALWPVGKITQVFPSPDGQVRVAQVTIGKHTYKRPVAKLVALPEMSNDVT
ncbi:hypothetical protein WMY93_004300 [Mugilogobius chulae]|uniref:Integrase catalytic domain-containing protein n=1 Tax=Mugilogobius chulae TaxID=88201 RepID=A0AAW0PQP1_9GOBI